MLHPDDINQVRNEADIVKTCELVGSRVTRKSRFYFIQCPFHDDSAGDGGSCSITPRKNIFHCFGCHEAGNIFKLYGELKGYTSIGYNFARCVREIHEFNGASFPLREIGAKQAPVYKLIEPWLQQLLDHDPLTIRDHTVPAWLIPTQQDVVDCPPEIKSLFISLGVKDVEYPLVVRHVEAAACAVVSELATERPIAVIVADPENANFVASRNVPRKMTGAIMAGDTTPADAPKLFNTRVAVENPLDWLLLISMRLPACWGVFDSQKKQPFQSPRHTIPAIIQLHVGSTYGSMERFHEAAQSQLHWLPRELQIRTVESLIQLSEEHQEYLEEKILLASNPLSKSPPAPPQLEDQNEE